MRHILESFRHSMDCNPMTAMFPDLVQAHEFMMDSWKFIYRHSLSGMKGFFTGPELSLIIDCHNAHAMTPMMYGSAGLLHNVSDSMALDCTDKKWEVNPDQIKEKLLSLSAIQAHCLEVWAVGFWYGKDQAKGLEDYLKQLA